MAITIRTVFISYSRKDREFVDRLADELLARGIEVFVDRKALAPGKRWSDELQHAIKVSRTMVVVLSPDSVASTHVKNEIAFAEGDGDTIIPVLYRTCEIPLSVSSLQYCDLRADYASGIAELSARLRERMTEIGPSESLAGQVTNRLPIGGYLEDPRRRRVAIVVGGLLAMAGVLALVAFRPIAGGSTLKQPGVTGSAKAAASLKLPKTGLETIDDYETATDSRAYLLKTATSWQTAARDFETHLKDPENLRAASERVAEEQSPDCERASMRYWRAAAEFCYGRVAMIEGHLDDALAHFNHALGHCPKWSIARSELAAVHVTEGRLDEALDALSTAQMDNPDAWHVHVVRGSVLFQQGKPEDAITELEIGVDRFERDGRTPPALLLGSLALAIHAARGHDEKARRVAEQAIQIDPGCVAARVVLGEQAFEAGELAAALMHTQKAVDSSGHDVAALLLHGDVLQVLGRTKDAREAHTRAVSLWKEAGHPLGAPPKRLLVVDKAIESNQEVPLRLPQGWLRSSARSQHLTDPSQESAAADIERSEPGGGPCAAPEGAFPRSEPPPAAAK
jgi:tetratricopeptide (TPR) repeat protein